MKSGAQGRMPVIGRTTTVTSIWSIFAELRMVTFRLCAPPFLDGAPDFRKLEPRKYGRHSPKGKLNVRAVETEVEAFKLRHGRGQPPWLIGTQLSLAEYSAPAGAQAS